MEQRKGWNGVEWRGWEGRSGLSSVVTWLLSYLAWMGGSSCSYYWWGYGIYSFIQSSESTIALRDLPSIVKQRMSSEQFTFSISLSHLDIPPSILPTGSWIVRQNLISSFPPYPRSLPSFRVRICTSSRPTPISYLHPFHHVLGPRHRVKHRLT